MPFKTSRQPPIKQGSRDTFRKNKQGHTILGPGEKDMQLNPTCCPQQKLQ